MAINTYHSGHGVLWGPVWRVAAALLGPHFSPDSVTAVLWQKAVGGLSSEVGRRNSKGETKGDNFGGDRD